MRVVIGADNVGQPLLAVIANIWRPSLTSS